jgi:UDP-N-acetylglucosamine 2-epimerase
MDKVFFEELQLPHPDHHLGVGSGSHASQTGIMLERIEAVLQKEKPEGVVVYGDTNSTLAGALTAAKLHIPVAHVEAGLRSYQRTMPEEINRLLTDHLSSLLFCPTASAVSNLEREGIMDGKEKVVKKVGDVMYDSILYYSKIADKRSRILERLDLLTPNSELPTPNYYLATLHRAENTDNPERLRSLLKALCAIGKKAPVIFPLHPRTDKMIKVHRLLPKSESLRLIDPVSYFDMLTLEKNAKAILTDSGGVQKEAYWLKVPCLTLREETEWVETLRGGWNMLVGTKAEKILRGVSHFDKKGPLTGKASIFGDGRASEKIVQRLISYFG